MLRKRVALLVAAAMMVLSMLAASAPVFAQGKSETAPNCANGNETAYFSPGGDDRSSQATSSLDKVYYDKPDCSG